MENYSPAYNFNGVVSAANAPSADAHLVRMTDVSGLSYISSIDASSSGFISVDAEGAISINSLLISDVEVDTTQTSLANFISNEAVAAAALKTGDILVLTNATGGSETWIISGTNGSLSGNYTKIDSNMTAAEIVAKLSGGTGINIAVDGTISFNGDTDDVAEGSTNLYWTQARFNSALTAKSTSDLSEGTNLYYTSARFDTAFGGKTTANLSEHATALYYTNARARGSVSATASGAGSDISYNNSTGVFSVTTYKTADFNTDFSAQYTTNLSEGTNLYYTEARADARVDAGFTAKDTDSLSEGSVNLYYSDVRARAAISGNSGVTVSSGVASLDVSYIRTEFSTQSLVANTAKTLTHNLGEKFVHVSVYDSNGNKIEVDIKCTSTSECTVTSYESLSNVEIICSL